MNKFHESGNRAWRISGNKNCLHESTILLGSDKGSNQYYQCQECGAVIVEEGESSPEMEQERIEKEIEEKKSGFDKFIEKLR